MPALVALSHSRRSKSSVRTYGCNSCVEIFTKRYTRVDGAESGFPKVSDLSTGGGRVTVRSLFVVCELGRRAHRILRGGKRTSGEPMEREEKVGGRVSRR